MLSCGDNPVDECPPLSWKVCVRSTATEWIAVALPGQERSPPTAPARSKFQVLACWQLPSPKLTKICLLAIQRLNSCPVNFLIKFHRSTFCVNKIPWSDAKNAEHKSLPRWNQLTSKIYFTCRNQFLCRSFRQCQRNEFRDHVTSPRSDADRRTSEKRRSRISLFRSRSPKNAHIAM